MRNTSNLDPTKNTQASTQNAQECSSIRNPYGLNPNAPNHHEKWGHVSRQLRCTGTLAMIAAPKSVNKTSKSEQTDGANASCSSYVSRTSVSFSLADAVASSLLLAGGRAQVQVRGLELGVPQFRTTLP